MNTGPTFRLATVADITALRRLYRETDEFHAPAFDPTLRSAEQSAPTDDYLTGILGAANDAVWVSEEAGQLVAMLQARFEETKPSRIYPARRIVLVDLLVVTVHARGRGIGRQLMHLARDWAIAKGAEALELRLMSANKEAVSFYEALGMRPILQLMRMSLPKA